MTLQTVVVEVESPNFTGKLVVLKKNGNQFSSEIKTEAILGHLKDPEGRIIPDNFVTNRSFLTIIEKHFCTKEGDPITTSNQEEWLYVIDARSKGNSTPPEYIVGAYKLAQGKKLEFTMNPNYRVLTYDGFPDFGEAENADFMNFVWSNT